MEPHVGRGVRLQRDHAVLATGKRGAQVLNSVIRLYTLLFYRQKQTVDLHSVLLSKQLRVEGMLLSNSIRQIDVSYVLNMEIYEFMFTLTYYHLSNRSIDVLWPKILSPI